MPPTATVTPAMRQYLDAKRQYRDAIVFFRMGDFYEMFYEDALVAARALELTLTSRSKDAGGNGIPMCGVPFHAGRRLHRAARQEGLSGRDLRAGRGSQEGQGARPARGRARRLAGNAHRCQLSRRTRAGVPDGDRRVRIARAGVRRRVDRPLHRRVQRGRVSRRGRARGAGRRSRRAAAARDRRLERTAEADDRRANRGADPRRAGGDVG